MKDTALKEIMIKKVIRAHEGDRLSLVEKKFRENNIRHLPIVDDQNRLVGIFTLSDLTKCVLPRRTEDGEAFDPEQLDQFILERVMTKNPLTLGPEDTLTHAAGVMVRNKYGCIPIVDKEHILVGIVSQIDILRYVSKQVQIG